MNTTGAGCVPPQQMWTCDPNIRPPAIASRKNMFQKNRHFNLKLLSLTIIVLTLGMGAIFTGQMSKLANAVATNSQSPAPSGLYFDHTVIVIMEDHGIQEICAQSPPPCSSANGAPYMASLANSYTITSQYLGVSHFSEADYLALLGGDTFGCSNAGCPPVSNQNLVDRLETSGLSWKGYIENQNVASGCDTTYHEPYTPEHNPFVGFTDILNNPTRCSKVVLANPSSCTVTDCVLVNDLNSASAPNFMWLTPNNCDNMHGFTGICPTSVPMGDNYLSSLVPNILNSVTFKTERSALFVVFDEGNGYCPLNGSSEDCVYASWIGPEAKNSFATGNLYNHYSWTKTLETNWNLPSLTNNDVNAKPMTEFFTNTPTVQFTTSFSYSPSSPQTGQQVAFTASGSGGTSPYSFSWTFGDGTNGTGATAHHIYSTTGTYTVVLTAKDSSNVQQTATSQQNITVTTPTQPPPGLTASFTATVTNPTVGQTVSFTSSATGGTQPYTFSWNFGDSSSGSGQNVAHSFQSAGVYSVVLTVKDNVGHTASATQTMTVSATLTTSFTYSPSNPSMLQSIQFTSSTLGGTAPYSYSWDFGDGATGTGATATHSYTLPGTYTVTLTVTDANGLTATASPQTVTVSAPLGL